MDGKLLRIIAIEFKPTRVCCPQAWREAKVIPLPKNSKAPFTGSNSRPISLLPTLSKLLEKMVFDQIKSYVTD